MLRAFCTMMHNRQILKTAENTINSFTESDNCRIWFEDEKGQRFIPHGKIKIHSIEYTKPIANAKEG